MSRIDQAASYINNHLASMKARRDCDCDCEEVWLEETLHTFGVAYFSAALAYRRNLNPELAYIIGLLHDAGRIVKDVMDKTHGPVGAAEAERFLRQSGLFSNEEIAIVYEAISNHSKKKAVDAAYDEVLKDADLMERIFFTDEHFAYSQHKRQRLQKAIAEFGLR